MLFLSFARQHLAKHNAVKFHPSQPSRQEQCGPSLYPQPSHWREKRWGRWWQESSQHADQSENCRGCRWVTWKVEWGQKMIVGCPWVWEGWVMICQFLDKVFQVVLCNGDLRKYLEGMVEWFVQHDNFDTLRIYLKVTVRLDIKQYFKLSICCCFSWLA